MSDVVKPSDVNIIPLLNTYIDKGLNALVQTEILTSSHASLQLAVSSLETANAGLHESLKEAEENAVCLAEELGRVRGKGGEGWRERRREVEEEREAEMELARLREIENAHVLLLGDKQNLSEENRRLKMKVQLVTQQHLSEKSKISKEAMEQINASSQAQLLKRKVSNLQAQNESLQEKLRESDRANIVALQEKSKKQKKKKDKAYGR
ncbi:hypothetical protein TrLO_g9013 [Triparma laevis f. longispina]|uniref:Uncharacterized protein n=1 Tax=Triparma laevis f. longispina TaxID=1714387 RepID=A0A9W7KTF3_9STRA|nr:hypothetical protein TrLO_g9013 [Triparma laevis f. longispina]